MPVITPRPTGHNAQRWSGIIGAGWWKIKGLKAYIQANITQYTPTIALRTTLSRRSSLGRFSLCAYGSKAGKEDVWRKPP
jgi:hypothetical protein